MATQETYVPTQDWIDAAVAFDPQAAYTQDQLAEASNALRWLRERRTDGEGPADAEAFNAAYGTNVDDAWLVDWLYNDPGSDQLLQDKLAEVQIAQGFEVAPVEEAAPASPRAASASPPKRASPSPAPVRRVAKKAATPPGTPPRQRTAAARGATRTVGAKQAARRSASPSSRRKRTKSPAAKVAQDDSITNELKRIGVDETAFWETRIPGEEYEAPEGTFYKEAEAGKRAAAVADLVKYYKEPFASKAGVSKINKVLHVNNKVLDGLHKAIVRYERAFAKYGKDIVLSSTPEGSKDAVYAGYDAIAYLEYVRQQRQKFTTLVVQALRTRKPAGAKPGITQFKGSNTRLRLTPEAVGWVDEEDFSISAKLAVVQDGVRYTNLWDYIQAVTGVAKNQTFLYAGYVTLGNYLSLLRHPLVKIPAPPKPEVKKGQAKPPPGPRHVPKYKYTKAMEKWFVNTVATLNFDADGEKIENNTDQSLVSILAQKATAAGKGDSFSTENLPNPGIFILRAASHYSNDEAAALEPAPGVAADFFGAYSPAKHAQFIKESQAIAEFYRLYSQNEKVENKRLAELKKIEDKAAKKTQLRARVRRPVAA